MPEIKKFVVYILNKISTLSTYLAVNYLFGDNSVNRVFLGILFAHIELRMKLVEIMSESQKIKEKKIKTPLICILIHDLQMQAYRKRTGLTPALS